MALRFCDSFSHYDQAARLRKWDVETGGVSNPGANGIQTSGGRWGTGGMRLGAVSGQVWTITKILDAQQTWTVGFALNFLSSSPLTNARRFLGFYDGATLHVDLRTDTSGHLQVTRNGTVLGTSTTVFVSGTWYYVELKVKIDDTVGTFELHVNGVQDAGATGSGADTRNAGNASADRITVSSDLNTGIAIADIGDLYICDGTGATNNSFLGDCRVECLYPNGNGNSSQFTGSDGNSTDNYLLVDETPENDDTDYVEDSTVNDKDTYAYTNATPTTGTVYGVQTTPMVRKTDAGTRSIRNLARLSGTEIDNGADIALSTSYVFYRSIFETKPGGGSWTLTDVNSAEFGVKVAA